MQDDPNLPRERERLTALAALNTARAQLDGTPDRDTGELRGGLYVRLERAQADVEATEAAIALRLERIKAAQAVLDEIAAEYPESPGVQQGGDEMTVAGADVADAAWLAGSAGEGN